MSGAVVNCGADVGIQAREVRLRQSHACDEASKRNGGSLLLEQSVHHMLMDEAGPLFRVALESTPWANLENSQTFMRQV